MTVLTFKGTIAFKDPVLSSKFLDAFEQLLQENCVDFDGKIKEYQFTSFDETSRD